MCELPVTTELCGKLSADDVSIPLLLRRLLCALKGAAAAAAVAAAGPRGVSCCDGVLLVGGLSRKKIKNENKNTTY